MFFIQLIFFYYENMDKVLWFNHKINHENILWRNQYKFLLLAGGSGIPAWGLKPKFCAIVISYNGPLIFPIDFLTEWNFKKSGAQQ